MKLAAARIKAQIAVLYFACQDPEVGWMPKAVATLAVAYAFRLANACAAQHCRLASVKH